MDRPADADRFRRRAQALGDPTRHAIYQWIAVQARPVAVAELVDEFGLNHNTVRQHLTKLRAADLVVEEKSSPQGPGRPRLLYRLTSEAAAEWNDEGPYQRLAMMLLEVASGDRSAEEVGEEVGRALGGAIVPGSDPLRALMGAMSDQGFAPRVVERGDGVHLVLDHCPFAAAAEEHPEVVCALHRGLAAGTAEAIGGMVPVRLVPKQPRRGGCRLEVAFPPA